MNPLIHLHHIPTLFSQTPFKLAKQSLDTSELSSCLKIKAERRLHEFVYGRYCLKNALAQHLNCNTVDIQLDKHPEGKLYLTGHPTFFNLTHSGEYLAYIIHDSCEVGIDIEHATTRDSDWAGIAERYFCPAELQAIRQTLEQDSHSAKALFYKIWTLKEATLKAQGAGISSGLDHLDTISAIEGEPYTFNIQSSQKGIFYHYANPHGLSNVYLSCAFLDDRPMTKPQLA